MNSEARPALEQDLVLSDKLPGQWERVCSNLIILLMREGLRHVQAGTLNRAEQVANEVNRLRQRARARALSGVIDGAVNQLQTELSRRERKYLNEFVVLLTVLGVEDPVERWKTLGHEISECWPKGVSAVKAIREERS